MSLGRKNTPKIDMVFVGDNQSSVLMSSIGSKLSKKSKTVKYAPKITPKLISSNTIRKSVKAPILKQKESPVNIVVNDIEEVNDVVSEPISNDGMTAWEQEQNALYTNQRTWKMHEFQL